MMHDDRRPFMTMNSTFDPSKEYGQKWRYKYIKKREEKLYLQILILRNVSRDLFEICNRTVSPTRIRLRDFFARLKFARGVPGRYTL